MSRLTAPLLIKTRDYVDEQGPKYKFYSFFVEAKHLVTWHRAFFALIYSFVIASFAYGSEIGALLVVCVLIIVIFSGRYAEYLLGGVMGDYLGATICVTEIYLLTVITFLNSNDGFDFAFVSEMFDDCFNFATKSLTISALTDKMINDERKTSLLRFLLVTIWTTIWCSCVGHPPVFVRKTVAAKGETEEIQIALSNGNKKEKHQNQTQIVLVEAALLDQTLDFKTRYHVVRDYLDSLAKPVGSLGTLEDWAARLAVLQRSPNPTVNKTACLIFAGDHGVAKDEQDGGANCSAYTQAVTQKVLEALEYDLAGASILASNNDVFLRVIDVGLAKDSGCTFGAGNIVLVSEHKVKGGTKNFCVGPAMSDLELHECIVAGRKEAKKCIEEMQVNALIFGEVGIGNTTTSSALIAGLTGETVSGLCDSGAAASHDEDGKIVTNKIKIVEQAMKYHKSSLMKNSPLTALKLVGGAEIAAIVGGILEASDKNVPVLVDGFIVTTAAMIAALISPAVCRVLCFATKSTERGQRIAINTIQRIAEENEFPTITEPALDMNLRMGEGTGALLAISILRSSAAILSKLPTLETVLSLKLPNPENATC